MVALGKSPIRWSSAPHSGGDHRRGPLAVLRSACHIVLKHKRAGKRCWQISARQLLSAGSYWASYLSLNTLYCLRDIEIPASSGSPSNRLE
ncbi:jg13162 [Pararge aegeria aegeria]|uniref:Jg13162 protein n=1 Tax=Pararge aegeria aegeria TaxID=348720 RepID=A0A8S4RTA1_9NEOP|nr:jg13162 [Pararge aegeria aegeria]